MAQRHWMLDRDGFAIEIIIVMAKKYVLMRCYLIENPISFILQHCNLNAQGNLFLGDFFANFCVRVFFSSLFTYFYLFFRYFGLNFRIRKKLDRKWLMLDSADRRRRWKCAISLIILENFKQSKLSLRSDFS